MPRTGALKAPWTWTRLEEQVPELGRMNVEAGFTLSFEIAHRQQRHAPGTTGCASRSHHRGALRRTYDGFVVLHGSDTMAYTASALSFLLDRVGQARDPDR
jgi:L-asparaginase